VAEQAEGSEMIHLNRLHAGMALAEEDGFPWAGLDDEDRDAYIACAANPLPVRQCEHEGICTCEETQ
jgi:hypothetical protein